MRFLVLLLALATTPSLASLLGSRKCTYGPSYWCSDLRASAECGATRHCVDLTWSRMRLQPDDDDVCTICKNMVQQARDVLNSNQTLVSSP